jgi:glycosyltransferase involved in cell wall biosynthesis
MAFYNNERTIERSVRSILCQTFKNFEFLILDDGSQDKSFDIVSSIMDDRLKIFRNISNMGLSFSLNRLLSESSFEYVARMDADDYSLRNRLENQLNFLRVNKNISVLGTSLIKISNKKFSTIKVPTDNDSIRARMLFSNSIFHPTVIYKKSVVVSAGGYFHQYRRSQDYDLWMRLMSDKSVKFANIQNPYLYYNQIEPNRNLVNEGDEYRDALKENFYLNIIGLDIKYLTDSNVKNDFLILWKTYKKDLIRFRNLIYELFYQFLSRNYHKFLL